jgi:hypothetical protein
LAAFVVTAAVYAAVGAVVAAIGSIIQQGLFIALGYQESFSWKQVGTAAITGALSGAAAGIGAAAQAAAAAGQLTSAGATYAQVASAALKASSAAAQQLLTSGKITSWTSLASAFIGQYASTGQGIAAGAATYATKIGDTAGVNTALESARAFQTLSTVNNYATPWVQLAETYVRNDGKVTPMDWANAAGSTLNTAIGSGTDIQSVATRLGANLLVAGVLSKYDKEGAQSFLENAVGQEAGQFIGGRLTQGLQPEGEGLVYDPEQDTFVDRSRGLAYDEELGALVNKEGNPVAFIADNAPKPRAESAPMLEVTENAALLQAANNTLRVQLADAGATMTDVGRGYGDVNFGSPIGATPESDEMYQAMVEMLEQGTSAAPLAGVPEADPRRAELEHVYKFALINQDMYSETAATGPAIEKQRQALEELGVYRLTDEEISRDLGIDTKLLRSDSGYSAGIYYDASTQQYIVANRGTEFTQWNDWENNLKQGLGFTADQYDKAINLAKALGNRDDVIFTGHSLGGGLASAQALAVQKEAITFNAAGLSAGTIDRNTLDTSNANKLITAYYVQGEVLSRLQDSPIVDYGLGPVVTVGKNIVAAGNALSDLISGKSVDTASFGRAYMPEATGSRVEMPAVDLNGEELGMLGRLRNTVALHGMEYVLMSIAYQRKQLGTGPVGR